MIKSYRCPDCNTQFEFHHHPSDEPASCPNACATPPEWCPSTANGPSLFHVNIPVYPGAHARMAGYVHLHNRPGERRGIAVPSNFGNTV